MAPPSLGFVMPCLALAGVALSTIGCAAKPASAPAAASAGEAPAADPPAADPGAGDASSTDLEAADDAGGGEAGGGKRKDKEAKEPDAVTSTPSGEPEEKRATSARRRLTTVADALDAFEEDEIRLSGLLDDKNTTTLDTSACGSVCDALASMRRASDAICDLAGDDDPRCEEARGKLAGNRKKIAGRGCQCST